jgi:lipid-A-disaccharide synthase
VLPGSRHSEVKRLLPILKDAVRQMVAGFNHKAAEQPQSSQIFVVVPTVAAVEEDVRRGFEDFELPVRVVTGTENRYNAFAISTIALAKSGTVSLELAAVGVPHLIMYKFNALSNLAAKLLVKIRFANLINLMADREIVPEFVLDNCRADLIADGALKLLNSPQAAEQQVIEAREVMQRLRLPDVLPSDAAAKVVIEMTSHK